LKGEFLLGSNNKAFAITLDKGVNAKCLVLIKTGNEAVTSEGRQIQSAHAAFIDGYTSATGELSRFITHLYKTDKATAAIVHTALKPLCELQDKSYTVMCDRLNDRDSWDGEV